MGLTHEQLRTAKSRRSLEDLNLLIAHAEETIGTPPLRTVEVDENGERGSEGTLEESTEETPEGETSEGETPEGEDA